MSKATVKYINREHLDVIRMKRVSELIEVRVLAVAEGWAMVRRKRATPFCVRESNLSDAPPEDVK